MHLCNYCSRAQRQGMAEKKEMKNNETDILAVSARPRRPGRVLDRFSETRDSLLRSRCLATRRSRRRRAANGRRRSPHRCRRRRRSSTPILLSRCSPLSRERGLLRRHHVVCSTRVDRDDNTRERERERDVRSFKTPGEGSSAPSSSLPP